jgi:hypothetical protein
MNMMFTITFLAILFAYILNNKNVDIENKKEYFKEIFSPYILILGIFIGYFKGANLWDMVIYFVILAITLFVYNFKKYEFNLKTICLSFLQITTSFLFNQLLVIFYSLSFDNPISQINFVEMRTPLYKFIILWGFPALCTLIGLICILKSYFIKEENKTINILKNIKISDIFTIIISICALGLIITPEIIYIDDIYTGIYERANTVYKMTYQAFIMFGICIGIYIPELFVKKKRILSTIFSICLVLCCGYYINMCNAWYNNFENNANTNTINSTHFLYNNDTFENDKYIIDYINEKINKESVIIEAVGEAYTNESRISVLTGNPTILGWSAHEWGWHGGPELINERIDDINKLYCGSVSEMKSIIEKYNIDYIYCGEIEFIKYKTLNIENLLNLCKIEYVHRDVNNNKIIYYLLKVNK